MWNDENKLNPGVNGEPSESANPGESAPPGEPPPRPVEVAGKGTEPAAATDDLFAPPSADSLPSDDQVEQECDASSPTVAVILARAAFRRRLRSATQHPDTREVILAWCLWLLITWVLLGFGASPAAIRWMVFLSLGGLVMLWPVFRLSQDGFGEVPAAEDSAPSGDLATRDAATSNPAPQPRSALTPGLILRDWLGMNIIFQAVVWPQIITHRWHADQAMFVSIAVAAWSLLVAAMVAWGCQRRLASVRTWVMVAILLLVWGEPLLMVLVRGMLPQWEGAFAWTMHVSPIEALYALTEPATTFEPQPWRPTLIAVLVAASVAWIGVGVGRK